jgi:hypothetical protein
VLSRIAHDVLAVPAPVVPSESAFSTGQRVVSDYRSRLKIIIIEALICLQDFLNNFESLVVMVDNNDIWGGMLSLSCLASSLFYAQKLA